MRQAIITGPTGAVGMALIDNLISEGIKVAAIVRPGSKRAERIPIHELVTKVECELSELDKLPELLSRSGFETGSAECRQEGLVFYHLGWDGTFGNSRNNMHGQNLNVKYSLDAVDAAHACGCEVWIGTGSQAEYGRFEGKLNASVPAFPENGYGIAKLCAGQMTRIACEQAGMRHVWTRILSIYGPYDGDGTMVMSTIAALLNGETPKCTKGEQQWDYLYSKDAGRALMLIGEKGVSGKTYCIGSGKTRPLSEYIEVIRDTVNKSADIDFGAVPYAPKQVFYLCADIEDLKKDTGFEPQTEFEDGIKSTVEYVKGLQSNRK